MHFMLGKRIDVNFTYFVCKLRIIYFFLVTYTVIISIIYTGKRCLRSMKLVGIQFFHNWVSIFSF